VPGDEGEDVALLRVTGCGGSTTMVRMAGSGKYTALVRRTKSRRRSFALLRMTGVGEIRRVAREDRVQEDPHLHLQLREVQVQVSLRSG
jgi:hypothetical protein